MALVDGQPSKKSQLKHAKFFRINQYWSFKLMQKIS